MPCHARMMSGIGANRWPGCNHHVDRVVCVPEHRNTRIARNGFVSPLERNGGSPGPRQHYSGASRCLSAHFRPTNGKAATAQCVAPPWPWSNSRPSPESRVMFISRRPDFLRVSRILPSHLSQ
jgi:hypothetical protein